MLQVKRRIDGVVDPRGAAARVKQPKRRKEAWIYLITEDLVQGIICFQEPLKRQRHQALLNKLVHVKYAVADTRVAAPHAALLFYWAPLERQVRIEGVVARVPDADSDDYFAKRPRGSCIGAWASPQSQVIPDRDWLRQRVDAFDAEHGDTVPRPDNWGGYRLIPDYYEFWQGRESRLHDRLVYRMDGDAWRTERLAP
ncbi:MAG: pyridoxamine 5'-phosphate oxidase [Betaproteobacteria bacterium]|nr:pyridoxamine 5'-phosphate oxidase [Betaproteobacteria bacterium]